jgi:hypothetical protein
MQTDPAWKDNPIFSEYFHGDNGAAIGAFHQTVAPASACCLPMAAHLCAADVIVASHAAGITGTMTAIPYSPMPSIQPPVACRTIAPMRWNQDGELTGALPGCCALPCLGYLLASA